MTDDLIAFVRARLDDEEGYANAMGHRVEESQAYSCPGSRTEPCGDLEWGEEHCWCGLAARKGHALREVAAKRAIVNNYETCATADRHSSDITRPEPIDHFQDGLGWALEQLASVYSDHPDYQQEWGR